MRTIPVQAKIQIAALDNTWVEEAYAIARKLWESLTDKDRKDKERQLRNVQSVAEHSESWAAVRLFLLYQAARGEIPKKWAEETAERLEKLREHAKKMASQVQGADENALHMEIISRVLGYAIRWHVWDVKGKEESR